MTPVIQLLGTRPRLIREELLPVDDVRNPRARYLPAKVTLKCWLVFVVLILLIAAVSLALTGYYTSQPQLVVGQPPDSDSDQQQPPSLQLSRLLGNGNQSGQSVEVSASGTETQKAVAAADGRQVDDDGAVTGPGKPQSDLISEQLQQQERLIQQQAQLLQQLQDSFLQQQQAKGSQRQNEESKQESLSHQTDDKLLEQAEEGSRFLERIGSVENQSFPVGLQPGSIRSQPNPDGNQHGPGRNQPGSTENQPSAAENQPSPVQNYPSPVENQPSPVKNQPSPVENQPSPTENQPSLAENQPSPAENQLSPVQNQPSSIENQPGSVTNQPSSIENQPGSVRNQPGLLEHQPGREGNQPRPTGVQPDPVGERRAGEAVNKPQAWRTQEAARPQPVLDALTLWRQRLGRPKEAKKDFSQNHPNMPVGVPPRKPQPEPMVGPQAAKDAAAMFAEAGQRAKAMEAMNDQRDSGTRREPLQRPPVQGQQYQGQPYQRQPYQRQPYQREQQPYQRERQPYQNERQPYQRERQPYQRERQPYQRDRYQTESHQPDGRFRPWSVFSRGKRSADTVTDGFLHQAESPRPEQADFSTTSNSL